MRRSTVLSLPPQLVFLDKAIAFDKGVGYNTIGLYHPLDGITNLKYKLLCFLTPNKKIYKEKGTSF
jgi:hypothetical protein